MTDFLTQYNIGGLVLGLATFLIIGLFHPLVIKGEYYFGTSIKWIFLAAGIVCLALSLCSEDFFIQALLGVTSFSCFWSIKEVEEQRERVLKGWFPMNPRRKHCYEEKEAISRKKLLF